LVRRKISSIGSEITVQMFLTLLIAAYALIGIRLFNSWFKFLLQDDELSFQWRCISVGIIIFASVLWVVVVPIAYLELLNKIQNSKAIAETTELQPSDKTRFLRVPICRN
jgi:hypothetical protein